MTRDQLKSQVFDRMVNHPHIASALKQEILAGLTGFNEAKLKEILSIIEEFDTKFIEAYDKAIVTLQKQLAPNKLPPKADQPMAETINRQP